MTNTTLDSADTVYGDQYDLAVGVSFLLLSILGTIYNSTLNHQEIMVTTPGTLGNGLTVVVLARTRRLYNHCTPLLMSLAVGEMTPYSDRCCQMVTACVLPR